MADKLTAEEIKKFKKMGLIERCGEDYVLTKKGSFELELVLTTGLENVQKKNVPYLLKETERQLGRSLTDTERKAISDHYSSVIEDVYQSYKKLENYKPKPAAGLFTGYAG